MAYVLPVSVESLLGITVAKELIDDSESWKSSECKDWGHATSKDLYTWIDQAIVLRCNEYSIYSGSIVMDKNNTSGLFPKDHSDGVVAIYTQHHLTLRTEEQAIAYSLDGGYTFQKYDRNPVLRLTNGGSYEFRDPKVIWHDPTKKWVMTVAKAAEQAVVIYTSSNLLDWKKESEFRNSELSKSRPSFECPNLVPIPQHSSPSPSAESELDSGTEEGKADYILLVSSGGGSPVNQGSVTRYFPGHFNGTHFISVDDRADRVIDFGPDNYASQFFFGLSEGAEVVSLGWAANFAYAGSVPTGPREGWVGMLTGPRVGRFVLGPEPGDVVYQSRPFPLDSLKGAVLLNEVLSKESDLRVPASGSRALLLEARLEARSQNKLEEPMSFEIGFESEMTSEKIWCSVGFGSASPSLLCDRSQAISDWVIPDSMKRMSLHEIPSMQLSKEASQQLEVQIVIDRSIMEIYLNDGMATGTMTFFPQSVLDTVYVRCSSLAAGTTISILVQELDSDEITKPLLHGAL